MVSQPGSWRFLWATSKPVLMALILFKSVVPNRWVEKECLWGREQQPQ